MKFIDDYQAFTRTTAVYPEVLAMPYLALGMCDEAGELLEKVLAFVEMYESTGKQPGTQWINRLLAEAGDVMWYVARITDSMSMPLSDITKRAQYTGMATLLSAASHITVKAAAVAGRCKKLLRDGDTWSEDQRVAAERVIVESLFGVVAGVQALAMAFGRSLADVLNDNQSKLSDRLTRNVIKGDGDNR